MEINISNSNNSIADYYYRSFYDNYKGVNKLFYYSIEFRYLLQQTLNDEYYYFTVMDKSGPIAIFPSFLRKTEYGNVLNSLPFFGPNAGLLHSYNNEQEICELFEFFFSEIESFCKRMNCISVSIYEPLFSTDAQYYIKYFKPDFVTRKFTQVTDIQVNTTWNDVLRRNIRKAEKKNIIIKKSDKLEDWNQYYNIYVD